MGLNMIVLNGICRGGVRLKFLISAVFYCFFISSPASAQLIVIPGQSATCPGATVSQLRTASVKSKKTMPEFWGYYKTAWITSGRFEVLLVFDRKNGTTVALWSTVESLSGSTASGKLLQSDNVDRSLRKGDTVTFSKSDPIDWGVKSLSGNSWYGRYTYREALPQCDKKNREIMVTYFLTRSPVW